ncbi:ABC transporter substrate-binding protein [Iodobacter sp. LRB]|uniref:substrate-binding periplasmic protein n=1 Tax=unclassified Iodobacter TaxID=235634 RepID=UPI0015D50672|nr:ABC transporter substrate-binding protein [Iodobacter sp. BJB302]
MKYSIPFLCMALIASVCAAVELTIFANEEYRPVSYKDQHGMASGVASEIIKRHELRTGDKIKLEMSSWRRAYELALKGQGGIIGLSKTKERLSLFDYSEPVYDVIVTVVVKKGKEFPFRSVNDLKGKLVGMTNGASYGAEFNAALEAHLFSADFNYLSAARFKKLLHGRVDCVVFGGGQQGLLQALNSDPELLANQDQFVILEHPLIYDPVYLGFHKSMNMKPFLNAFNKTIKEAKNTGILPKTKN